MNLPMEFVGEVVSAVVPGAGALAGEGGETSGTEWELEVD